MGRAIFFSTGIIFLLSHWVSLWGWIGNFGPEEVKHYVFNLEYPVPPYLVCNCTTDSDKSL